MTWQRLALVFLAAALAVTVAVAVGVMGPAPERETEIGTALQCHLDAAGEVVCIELP